MSDIMGAKAISAVSNGLIEELPYARTFVLRSESSVHVVTIGAPEGTGTTCTCRAGQAGRECYAVQAAKLLMRKRRDEADGVAGQVVDIGGMLHRRDFTPIPQRGEQA